MPYRGRKRKDDDDFIDDSGSGSDGGESRVKKKPAVKESPNASDDGITVCELSNNRKVTVKQFKSLILIDIRQFYSKNGDSMPSKKGISLTVEQWKALRDHAKEVDDVIADLDPKADE